MNPPDSAGEDRGTYFVKAGDPKSPVTLDLDALREIYRLYFHHSVGDRALIARLASLAIRLTAESAAKEARIDGLRATLELIAEKSTDQMAVEFARAALAGAGAQDQAGGVKP